MCVCKGSFNRYVTLLGGREGSGFCYEALRKEWGGEGGHQLHRYVTGGIKIICEISPNKTVYPL